MYKKIIGVAFYLPFEGFIFFSFFIFFYTSLTQTLANIKVNNVTLREKNTSFTYHNMVCSITTSKFI